MFKNNKSLFIKKKIIALISAGGNCSAKYVGV
jgi:hypothetical protein